MKCAVFYAFLKTYRNNMKFAHACIGKRNAFTGQEKRNILKRYENASCITGGVFLFEIKGRNNTVGNIVVYIFPDV
jgi:hypothetical protein